jgi:hypothetical protein
MTATGEKTGGRQKGTPNKTTSEIRTKLQDFIAQTIDEAIINTDVVWGDASLTLKEKMDFIVKILPLILPRPIAFDSEKLYCPKQRH